MLLSRNERLLQKIAPTCLTIYIADQQQEEIATVYSLFHMVDRNEQSVLGCSKTFLVIHGVLITASSGIAATGGK